MRKVFTLILLLALGGGAWWWFSQKKEEAPQIAYKMGEVTQAEVVRTIRATGTIEPEDLIDIGAQVTGQIMAFGVDTEGNEVDYCSIVRKGQLLARIDDVTYKAEVTIAKANLTTARSSLARSEAELLQQQAKFRQAERDWKRAQTLGVGDALSQKDWDAYQSTYEVSEASLKVSEAQVTQAKASIEQAQAQLEKAERNLSYCDILSTVDGVIIDRRVNLGQTVTASMSTPSLFLVAKDLKKIEIWVPVNEADIGDVTVGLPVVFTVDAFPNKTFSGIVRRVRLNASMTSNVVTYTVEVATENPDGLLLPYLTANVDFILAKSEPGALTVPPAALIWRPEGWTPPEGKEKAKFIFVQDEKGQPVPLEVSVGVCNDLLSEVITADLAPGDSVITGTLTMMETVQAKEMGKNPFLPQPPRHQRRR